MRDDGGTAFPSPNYGPDREGMSLRDWFAGQVLAGILAGAEGVTAEHMPAIAAAVYQMADAMLAERAKP